MPAFGRPWGIAALVLLVALVGADPSHAAGGTSGTSFFTCWMETFDTVNDFGLAIANDGASQASVSVSSPSRLLQSAVIPPGDVHVFRFAPDDRNAPDMLVGTRKGLFSYRIDSDQPVTAYQFNTLLVSAISRNHTHDAATVLPLTSLGSRYLVTAWPQVDYGGLAAPSLIAIVGVTSEPASVTVETTAPVLAGDLPAAPAGTTLSFTLQRGEAVQLASDLVGSDFTGTVVAADRPIAVFGGSDCSQVPVGTPYCDHLEEQFFPAQAWGRDLIAPKSKMRGAIPDYWRVLAQRDGTSVTLAPDPLGGGPHALSAGEHLQFSSVSDVHVTATEPIQVTQYFAGSTYEGAATGPGDPSVFLVVPTEQFEAEFLFYVPELFVDDNVMIVAPSGASASLDGVPIAAASFVPIGATGYSKAIVPVADGVHGLVASAPSMAYVFGYERDTSYAYYAGGLPLPIGSSIACDVTQTVPGPCDAGRVALDASGSVGMPPLSWAWSSFTAGLTIASPTSAVTDAVVPAGGGRAAVTITSGDDAVTCWVDVPPPPPPAPAPAADCPAQVTVEATQRGGDVAVVLGTASGPCPPISLSNSRTGAGGDATDFYPCGITNVTFTATDARGERGTCRTRVEITQSWTPGELSGLPWGVPLRVTRVPGDSVLRMTFEDLAEPLLAYHAYGGTIPADGLRGRYDHAPIDCSFTASVVAPAVQELLVPFVPGLDRYFLVSAANCGAEGTRGTRSDGVDRPSLPTDCGLAR